MNNSGESNMRKFSKVCEILEEFDYRQSKIIPILAKVQEEYKYLPEEVMNFIATSMDLPPASVYGVATFYSHFAFKPKGKYVIKICDGTACHVKNSIPILESIRDFLGLTSEKNTTADMLFTLETVSCLGACGLAPVLVINEDVHGLMTPEKTIDLLKEIKNSEEAENVC